MKTTTAIAFLALTLTCTTAIYADTFGGGGNAFDIDFVTIGNPGNDADTGDGSSSLPGTQNFGSVDYTYRIGKYEISRTMIEKASTAGGLGLTLFDMQFLGGNGANQPATGISWYEAAQFVNWLNTSTGNTAAYKFNGSTFELWQDGVDAGYNASNPFRNSQAKYVLPSVDEWYKAAFYDPAGGGTYYNYPTGSDSVPTAVTSGTTAGTAVYNLSLNTGPAEINLAGGLSPYETMGQAGNVWEWEETDGDLLNNSAGSTRGLRGSTWAHTQTVNLSSSHRLGHNATSSGNNLGFRVASVPEPGTLLLGLLGTMGLLIRRTSRRTGYRQEAK